MEWFLISFIFYVLGFIALVYCFVDKSKNDYETIKALEIKLNGSKETTKNTINYYKKQVGASKKTSISSESLIWIEGYEKALADIERDLVLQ